MPKENFIDFEGDTPCDTQAAASFLGVTPAFMVQRRHRGQPPEFLKLGRAVRYLPSVLGQFREDCRVVPGGDTSVIPAERQAAPAGGAQ